MKSCWLSVVFDQASGFSVFGVKKVQQAQASKVNRYSLYNYALLITHPHTCIKTYTSHIHE